MELDTGLVSGDDPVDERQVEPRAVLLQRLVGEDDVLRGDRLTVRPAGVGPKREAPGHRIVAHGVLRGQITDEVDVLVDGEQRAVDQPDLRRPGTPALQRVELAAGDVPDGDDELGAAAPGFAQGWRALASLSPPCCNTDGDPRRHDEH
jgi:hypothetical protein